MIKSILIAGVGGQGILLAGDIIAQTAMESGYDVKKSEIHGMAQRGGSVVSAVRYGDKVYSPLISKGEADIILAFEKLEALRVLPYLKKSGAYIVNDYEFLPLSVAMDEKKYLDNTIQRLKEVAGSVSVVKGIELAKKTGNIRTINMVLVGALATRLGFPKEKCLSVIEKRVPRKTLSANRTAFLLGFST